jgi:hypothetical protein
VGCHWQKANCGKAAMKREVIILVHGTGATAPTADGDAWWQTDGPLWRRFREQALQPEAFIWSGENSEAARRSAGRALNKRLIELSREDAGIHLIGHSHGGSVIWHAFNDHRIAGSLGGHIRSWASVGTPFMHYGSRWPRFWLACAALALSLPILLLAVGALSEVEFEFARRDHPALSILWIILASIPALVAVRAAFSLRPFMTRWYSSRQADVAVPGTESYLGIWSSQDEPIIGLGASGSFSIKLMQEPRPTRARSWAGIVNHPIASATNQLVNNRVSRAIQGSTIAHLELRSTLNHPHVRLAQHALPDEIDSDLIDRANAGSAALGQRVRELLISGRDPVTGFADFQTAAAKAVTFKELVHTTYFDSPGCVELLIHHVCSHSTCASRTELPERLNRWYANRFVAALPRRGQPLPSNRMGYEVAGTISVVGLVLALTALSLSNLYASVFAPTTAHFHLQSLINEKRLAIMLASTVSGESLETTGSPLTLSVRNSSSESSASFSGADLSLLGPYIRNIVLGGELDSLLSAGKKLDTEELQTLFYGFALPLVLEHASEEQIRWVFDSSGWLPGPRIRVHSGLPDRDYQFPALASSIRTLAQRKLLTLQRIDQLYALCADFAKCKDRVKMQVAAALVDSGMSEKPDFLLPLPAASEVVKIPASDTKDKQTLELREPLFAYPPSETPPFLAWLAGHQAWEYVAAGGLVQVPLAWEPFDASVRAGLDTLHGREMNYLMQFVVRANWIDPLPEDVLARLDVARAKQQRRVSMFVDPIEIDQRAIDRLKREAKKKRTCLVLAAVPDEEFEAQRAKFRAAGVYCSAVARERLTPGMLLRDLKFATDATSFHDRDGFLDRFLARESEGGSPEYQKQATEILFRAFAKVACDEVDAQDYFSGAIPRPRIAEALRTLGPPPSEIPDAITRWLTAIQEQAPCAGWASANDGAKSAFRIRAGVLTFHIADWLHEKHSTQALRIMQWLSGTENGALKQQLVGEVGVLDVAAWYAKNSYSEDVLYATSLQPEWFRLMRRAAFFRVATCQNIAGRADRAELIARMAESTGALARTHARQPDLVPTIKAEATYFSWRADWQKAVGACAQCDSAAMLAVGTELIPWLVSGKRKTPSPQVENCDQFTDDAFAAFYAGQTEVEQRSREGANRRRDIGK